MRTSATGPIFRASALYPTRLYPQNPGPIGWGFVCVKSLLFKRFSGF